jgi:thioredoxin 1
MMLERFLITLIIIAALVAIWLAWSYLKARLIANIQPAEGLAGQPVLLYFTGPYCAVCQFQQTPIVEQLKARWGDLWALQKIDVSQEPQLASQYKVLTLPTTVVLDINGQVAHINYGLASQEKLETQLLAGLYHA